MFPGKVFEPDEGSRTKKWDKGTAAALENHVWDKGAAAALESCAWERGHEIIPDSLDRALRDYRSWWRPCDSKIENSFDDEDVPLKTANPVVGTEIIQK